MRSPPVRYRRPGEDLTEAPADEVVVTVESVLARAAGATDIRNIKPPEEPPVDWRPYYLAGAALAALAALALLASRLRRRAARAHPVPPPPPHEIALEELERLRARRLIEEGAFKEYYSRLSAIVRAYVERRFGLRSPEMTTEEFLLTSARSGRLDHAHRALLGEFLTESDLVKFARHLPTIEASARAWASARRFVEETASSAGGTATGVDDGAGNAGPAAPRERRRRAAG